MTPRGWGTGALGALALAGAVALRWPALAVTGAVLLALVLWSLRVRFARLRVQVVHRSVAGDRTEAAAGGPERVERESPVQLAYLVENRGRHASPTFHLLQPLDILPRPIDVEVPRIEPGRQEVRSQQVIMERRGIHRLGPVHIHRTDGFGFVDVHRDQLDDDLVVVTPRIHEMRPIEHGVEVALETAIPRQMTLGSMTFDRLRDYVDGDDLRFIDWRASARTDDELVVRQHIDTIVPATIIVLDNCAESYPGPDGEAQFEAAVDVAASVVAAESARNPVILVLSAGASAPTNDPMLSLTTVQLAPGGADLIAAVRSLAGHAAASNLVAVGGAPTAGAVEAAARVSASFGRIYVCFIGGTAPTVVRSPRGIEAIAGPTASDVAMLWNVAVR